MADESNKSRLVRLNVGGTVFVTTPGTLLSQGETFFSSLLSGRHVNAKDETGAFFIDRSPKYFDPILHYLRSGVLEIPPGVSRTALQGEAEFYGLETIVDYIDQLEAEKKQKEVVKVQPLSKHLGCYVDDDNHHAFLFSEEKKITFITGTQAFTQAMVIHNHPEVPPEWKQDQSHERSFAVFYQAHVQKGTFKMNAKGKGLIITLPGSSATSHHQHLATLSKDLTSLAVTSFSCSSGSGSAPHLLCTRCHPTHCYRHFHLYKFQTF